MLWEPILSYSGIMLSHCNFSDIDVTANFETIGAIFNIPLGILQQCK